MSTHTIDQAIRWWARDRGYQRAIWVSKSEVAYAEFDSWVGRVAAMLGRRGFEKGDRVVFYAETSLEWSVAALAAIRCGGIVAGLNSRMVSAEVDHLLGRYEPTVLFVDNAGMARIENSARIGAEATSAMFRVTPEMVADLRSGAPDDLHRHLLADDPVAIITTSGSTGRPKGVVYSHRSLIEYATYEALANACDLAEAESRLLTTAPLSTAGGFNLLISSMVIGGTVFMQSRFDPSEALCAVADYRINTFRANPIFFQRMAEHSGFPAADLSSLKIATAGGSQVSDSLLDAWWKKGVVLRQLYGQTEGGGSISVNPKRYAFSDPDRCGYGSPFVQVAIMDSSGRILPANEPGEIVARGPGMMVGYWRDQEATAATLVDGWLHTGDIGVMDERGLLKMLDRMKDIIRSGGFSISAAELERVILEFPGVEEAAIIAVKDEKFGEAPLAVIYGMAPIVDEIITHCRRQLAGYKIPKYVVISEAPLPRLAMGKISKPALRAQYGDRPREPPVR